MTHWFLDLDDTLVVGPVTWMLETGLPTLIRDHDLPLDRGRLDAALLRGQERAAHGHGEVEILDNVFNQMGWRSDLKQQVLREVFDRYAPALFEDTLPFLQRAGGVSVISNNNHAPEIAAAVGIAPYIIEYFTPKRRGVEHGKPERDLWDAVCASGSGVSEGAVLIGDNPWSDGAFAAACGIDCRIVDRLDRFAGLTPYPRVRSLAEIPGVPSE